MQAISPSLYPLLRSIIDESYTDGIDRITSARENDDGTILAVGVDGTKQIACKISDDNIKIRLLNPDAVSTKNAAFSSANIYEQLGMRLVELALEAEFAAPKKSNGSIKKKSCKTGLRCGGTCISKSKICARALSIDQQKQFKEFKKRLKGGDADAAKGIQDLKDEQQGNPKSKAASKSETKPASDGGNPDPDKAYEDAKKKSDNGIDGIGAGLDRLKSLKSIRDKGSISDKDLYATLESTFPDAHLASSAAAGGYMDQIYNKLPEKQKATLAATWYDQQLGEYPGDVFGKTSGTKEGVKKGHSPFLKDMDARIKKLRAEDGYDD